MTLELVKIIAMLCITHGGPVPYEQQSLCQSQLIACVQNQMLNPKLEDDASRLALCIELKD